MARGNYTDYTDEPIPNLPDQAAQPYGAATVRGYYDQADEYLTNHGIYHMDPQTMYDLAFRMLQVLAESEIRDPFEWHDRPNYRGIVASLLGELAHEYQMVDTADADSIKDLLESAQEAMSMHSRRAADPAQDALDILGAYADG
jgi:hypothetical protein